MTENIIYYSMCLFFSILGLGMTWESRSKHLPIKIVVGVAVPLAVAASLIYKPEVLAFFDARVIWSWVIESHNPQIRFRAMLAIAVFMGVAFYVVLIEHLVIACHKRITN